MKRAKIRLPQQGGWGSTVTKHLPFSNKVSASSFTEGTKNIDTYQQGDIIKRESSVDYGTPTGPIKDQFEAVFSDGTHHMLIMGGGELQYSSGSGTFSSVKAGYSAVGNMEFASYADRVYYANGLSSPQVYDRTANYGGKTALPVTITVTNFASLTGDTVTLGTSTVTEGVEWTAATSNDDTATSLAAAIDALAGITATATDNVVTVLSSTPSFVSASDVNLTVAAMALPRVRDMGVTAPSAAPTTALVLDSTVDQIPAGAHSWKISFVYYGAEESNAGPASSPALTTDGTHTSVDLTNIPLGAFGVTSRKVYRDDGDGLFRLVGSIDNNTATTFTDTASIGTSVAPSDNNGPRDWSLIVQHKDRMWVAGIAGDPSELDFSEAGLPDVFLSTGTILCNPSDPITGLVVYNDRVVVFNRNSFGQIYGTTSDSFRYSEVPGSVGCVDNRSIQIRTIHGVPVLMWLSAGKVFAFNGSTVEHISEDIEDQLRFNIQQANQVKGSNAQSTQSEFQNGTSSTGIDTDIFPGALTTKGQLLNGNPTNNPLEAFDTQAEWENPSASGAIVTRKPGLGNRLASAVKAEVKASTCVLSGLEGFNGNADIRTAPVADFTGAVTPATFRIRADTNSQSVAYSFTPPRSGVLTSFEMDVTAFGNITPRLRVWSDSFGIPGSVLGQFSAPPVDSTSPVRVTFSGSVPLVGGTTYWLGYFADRGDGIGRVIFTVPETFFPGGNIKVQPIDSSSWISISYAITRLSYITSVAYSYIQNPVPASGTFVSQTVDTGLFPQAASITVENAGTSAMTWGGTGSKSGSIIVEQADSDDMVTGLVASAPVVDPTQTQAYTFAATKRYWRVKGTLQTADDRFPVVLPSFYFTPPLSATWESQPIDCSADVTAYDPAVEVKSVASGGDATLTVATSDDNLTYSSYGPLGSADVKRYIKLKYSLASSTDGLTPSSVSSLTFSYKLSPVWQSQAIDLGAAPEGWDVLQVSADENGGGLSYELRSAATSGGLAAATYFEVTPGTFPNDVPLNRWAQWRVSFDSEAGKVPEVDSLTLNWFIKLGNSTRAASLFYLGSYYLCLSEYNQTTNNLMLVFDPDGKWRVHRDLNAGTFGFFFGDPYYGDAVDGKVKKLLGGINQVVELDVRTKAFDFDDITKRKMLHHVFLAVANTGATFDVSYSTDEGRTFQALRDVTGATTFTVPDDGGLGTTTKYLVPSYEDLTKLAGKTIMVRIHENTAKQVNISEIQIDAYIREGEYRE
jgi:hypothetical protein